MSSEPRFWLAVASREHVLWAVSGGFCQMCHGKAAPLRRMSAGDGIAYYSSRERMNEPKPCQRFTAIGQIVGGDIDQAPTNEDFCPSRRPACYLPCEEAPILPLIAALSFICDKKRWGFPFRFGLLEVSRSDFQHIANAMHAPNIMHAPTLEATPGEF
jgi:hypothetical protein